MLVNSSDTLVATPFLVSRNWCRDLNSMSRSDSLCLYYIFVSQPRFDVATSFMLSTSLLLGRSFSFRLRHHSVVLSLQAGRDSKLLVCLFFCRDVDIRSRPSNFFLTTSNVCRDLNSYVTTSNVCHDKVIFLSAFNHYNSYRDLKRMSRPFFSFSSSRNLISQSQQFPFNFLFLVTI